MAHCRRHSHWCADTSRSRLHRPAWWAFEKVGNAILTVVGWIQNLVGWLGNTSTGRVRRGGCPVWFGAATGVEFSGISTMTGGDSPGWLNFAASPWWLGGRAAVGGTSAPAVVNNWTVNVDGSGIVDPDKVAQSVTAALTRYRRTLGIPAGEGF